MKPIVKWAGGKTKLLPELLARVPDAIGTYVEPFAGGAALFFALADAAALGQKRRRFERAILADKNADLVACYRAVRDDVEAVISALAPFKYDRELYYEVRAQDPQKMSDVARAARLLFLNRTCYNGLWRVNSKGRFNVPFGKYTNPRISDPESLREASQLLKGVEIVHGDFATVTAGLGRGDFVYFDPPYVPVSRTADFTAYAADRFGAEEQSRLRDLLLALRKKKIAAMLSNADTPETRALYADLHVEVVRAPRSISRDGAKRSDIDELVVSTLPASPRRRAPSAAARGARE